MEINLVYIYGHILVGDRILLIALNSFVLISTNTVIVGVSSK
jgi:hypothetical protein